jgi:hypothetical protein
VNEQELHELMQDETFVSDEELASGGFAVIDRTDGGMVAHRGTLHPDEFVDEDVLRAAAEEALGFTYEDVSSAYAKGRPSAEQRQLREKIDSRLLALSRGGGNMDKLADAIGLGPATVDRALSRARAVEIDPIVRNPAVTHVIPCFKCERPARPRKRRFSQSPKVETGTVNLCDDCYAQGFIVIKTGGGVRAIKRHVNAVGLIQDKDTRTFGGHRHYGSPWVPFRDR